MMAIISGPLRSGSESRRSETGKTTRQIQRDSVVKEPMGRNGVLGVRARPHSPSRPLGSDQTSRTLPFCRRCRLDLIRRSRCTSLNGAVITRSVVPGGVSIVDGRVNLHHGRFVDFIVVVVVDKDGVPPRSCARETVRVLLQQLTIGRLGPAVGGASVLRGVAARVVHVETVG